MVRITSALMLLFCCVAAAQQIPAGIAIPVMLSTSLNSDKLKSDEKIEGKVMQDVMLADGSKIGSGAHVVGHIVEATKGSEASITLKFDAIEHGGQRFPLAASLLAVASMTGVYNAQIPINNTAATDSANDWVTRQVGGDVVNRGRGKVASATEIVGAWVEGNSVLAKLTPVPAAGCPEGAGYEQNQALWVFSSGACGVYGLDSVTLASHGNLKPIGNIVLKSSRKINIRGGSGWLLLTIPPR